MMPGDIVQVQQFDRGVHWVYATVITANADGSAFVQIRHPMNIDDGKMIFFGADKIRTKTMLQAMLTPPAGGNLSNKEKASLASQLEWLS